MVGTAVYQVGASSSTHSKKCSWWKPEAQATEAPVLTEARSAATRPWMWKSGITFRQRSEGIRPSVSATFVALAASCR
jgi:hypothetical protein